MSSIASAVNPAKNSSAPAGSSTVRSTSPRRPAPSAPANSGLATSSAPETTASAETTPSVAQARAKGAPCELPTIRGRSSPRSEQNRRMSPAKSEKVRPGAGVEAPSPGRSTEIRRTPSASTTPAPNPSHRLVAAPGHSRTGTPSDGPHSAQPSSRPSGSAHSPRRAGASTYRFTPVPSAAPPVPVPPVPVPLDTPLMSRIMAGGHALRTRLSPRYAPGDAPPLRSRAGRLTDRVIRRLP